MLDAGVLGIGDTKSDCNRAKKVLKKREIEERKWDIVCKGLRKEMGQTRYCYSTDFCKP